jgi:hypothetical protein
MLRGTTIASKPGALAGGDKSGQFVILRMNEEYWEGEVVRGWDPDPQLQWTFPGNASLFAITGEGFWGATQRERSVDVLQA